MKTLSLVLVLMVSAVMVLAACGGEVSVRRGSPVEVAEETINYLEQRDAAHLEKLRCDSSQSIGEVDKSLKYKFGELTYNPVEVDPGHYAVSVQGPLTVTQNGDTRFDGEINWTINVLQSGKQWCNDFANNHLDLPNVTE